MCGAVEDEHRRGGRGVTRDEISLLDQRDRSLIERVGTADPAGRHRARRVVADLLDRVA